jgi:hypothetical protein
MFRTFVPTIRSTRLRLAANDIVIYLQMGGGVKITVVQVVCAVHPHVASSWYHSLIVMVKMHVHTTLKFSYNEFFFKIYCLQMILSVIANTMTTMTC